MRKISDRAWRCADPGGAVRHHHQRLAHLQEHRPASTPPIRARSTCSSTTAPATSHRSTWSKFYDAKTASFDVDRLPPRHARCFSHAQEIIVDFASYPTEQIAQNSHDYRPLGLGYANLGTLLHAEGHSVRQRRGARVCGAAHRDPLRRAYALGTRSPSVSAPSRASRPTASRCCEVMEHASGRRLSRRSRTSASSEHASRVRGLPGSGAQRTGIDAVALGEQVWLPSTRRPPCWRRPAPSVC